MERLRAFFAALWVAIRVTVRRLVRGRRHPAWTWMIEVATEVVRGEIVRSIGRPLPKLRAATPTSPVRGRLRSRIRHEKTEVAGRRAEITTSTAWVPAEGPTVLYLHGGGYVVCGPRTHRELIARLADASAARCVAPVYRLAPEHPFPAALDDAMAVYRALLEEVGAQRLLLAGDSAGGGLSLATMLRARDEGLPLPAGAVLLSPWLDLTLGGESIDSNGRYDYLQRVAVEYYAAQYLQGTDPRAPLASPLHARLERLPPLLLLTGDAEIFHDEHRLFAERARAAGVDLTLHVGEGMVHVWPAFSTVYAAARTPFPEMGAFVRERGPRGAP